jgi:hypothetical protein
LVYQLVKLIANLETPLSAWVKSLIAIYVIAFEALNPMDSQSANMFCNFLSLIINSCISGSKLHPLYTLYILVRFYIRPKTLISLLLAHNSKAITYNSKAITYNSKAITSKRSVHVIQIPIPTTVKLTIYVFWLHVRWSGSSAYS